MTEPKKSNAKSTVVKFSLLAVITLLLLIPLEMVKGLIREREYTLADVKREIADSYAGNQTVFAPRLMSTVVVKSAANPSETAMQSNTCMSYEVNYDADIDTKNLHRSLYDVTVYNSSVKITGKIAPDANSINAVKNEIHLDISDFKGLADIPQLRFGDKTYTFEKSQIKDDVYLGATVNFPEGTKEGDLIDYEITMGLKGTEVLIFEAFAHTTTLHMKSQYPHPSFQGGFLPENRDVNEDGFEADWKVLWMNVNNHDNNLGVKFIEPANPYQQATRSAKYGMLIIILVFVAGLFVEFLTKREISSLQYAIIGLSLILFYSLLLSFSELVVFGYAYLIAAVMTTAALILYFKAILRNKAAYMLGLFTAAVYGVNYILLQMETYALLVGSLILFILLCVVMYLTADLNNRKAEAV